MEWKPEVATIPVAGLDRAQQFHAEKLRFKQK